MGILPRLNTAFLLNVRTVTHAMLQPVVDIERGEFSINIAVSDSGSPALASKALVNVTVCPCDMAGQCMNGAVAAIFGAKVGISLLALIIIMASGALLLCKSLSLFKGIIRSN